MNTTTHNQTKKLTAGNSKVMTSIKSRCNDKIYKKALDAANIEAGPVEVRERRAAVAAASRLVRDDLVAGCIESFMRGELPDFA